MIKGKNIINRSVKKQMDFLLEILFEVILEGTIELGTNKKVPPWIRYPCLLLVIAFVVVVIGGLFLVGILAFQENIFFGLFIEVIAIILLVAVIRKSKKFYRRRYYLGGR